MPRTVTIVRQKEGQSLTSTLQEAINILKSYAVPVDTAAQIPSGQGQQTATILLQYVDDKVRASRILANAGIEVK